MSRSLHVLVFRLPIRHIGHGTQDGKDFYWDCSAERLCVTNPSRRCRFGIKKTLLCQSSLCTLDSLSVLHSQWRESCRCWTRKNYKESNAVFCAVMECAKKVDSYQPFCMFIFASRKKSSVETKQVEKDQIQTMTKETTASLMSMVMLSASLPKGTLSQGTKLSNNLSSLARCSCCFLYKRECLKWCWCSMLKICLVKDKILGCNPGVSFLWHIFGILRLSPWLRDKTIYLFSYCESVRSCVLKS